jgi:hypothetical protein
MEHARDREAETMDNLQLAQKWISLAPLTLCSNEQTAHNAQGLWMTYCSRGLSASAPWFAAACMRAERVKEQRGNTHNPSLQACVIQ